MRASRIAALVTLSLSVAALAVPAACSSFEEEPPVTSDVAPDGEAPVGDAPVAVPEAAVEPDASLPQPRVCPAAKSGTTSPDTWSRKTLYTAPPADRGHPFAVTPDATHVTWVEQPQSQDGAVDPYDGFGYARIFRAPKAGAPPKILARDQLGALDLVIEGAYAYWTAREGTAWQLRRQLLTASCEEGPCPTPELVVTFPGATRVARLVRDGSGAILALDDFGKVYYVGPGAPDGGPLNIISTDIYPALAATTSHLYVSTGSQNAVVKRSTISANPSINDPYLTMPPLAAGGSPGAYVLATDCNSLWSIRIATPTRYLEVHDFATPGSLEPILNVALEVYDVAVDAKYVYLAGPAGGVGFTDRATKTLPNLYMGNVWRVSTDDDGVYFGAHAGVDLGNVYMVEKK